MRRLELEPKLASADAHVQMWEMRRGSLRRDLARGREPRPTHEPAHALAFFQSTPNAANPGGRAPGAVLGRNDGRHQVGP